jgi:hypothetical protein
MCLGQQRTCPEAHSSCMSFHQQVSTFLAASNRCLSSILLVFSPQRVYVFTVVARCFITPQAHMSLTCCRLQCLSAPADRPQRLWQLRDGRLSTPPRTQRRLPPAASSPPAAATERPSVPITFSLGGLEVTLDAQPGQNLWEAAKEAGADITLGCSQGSCGVCEARGWPGGSSAALGVPARNL